ncbi:MAG: hypothetical protein NBKEAIPA_01733 [Nitrospirae bacterium]|nr:hypothetical protein [Nitrospirota bacterium]
MEAVRSLLTRATVSKVTCHASSVMVSLRSIEAGARNVTSRPGGENVGLTSALNPKASNSAGSPDGWRISAGMPNFSFNNLCNIVNSVSPSNEGAPQP